MGGQRVQLVVCATSACVLIVSGAVAGRAGDNYARAKRTAIVKPATKTRAPRPEQTDLDAN
eukprot:11201629-Lingulodinium_polyedra.AAC.1